MNKKNSSMLMVSAVAAILLAGTVVMAVGIGIGSVDAKSFVIIKKAKVRTGDGGNSGDAFGHSSGVDQSGNANTGGNNQVGDNDQECEQCGGNEANQRQRTGSNFLSGNSAFNEANGDQENSGNVRSGNGGNGGSISGDDSISNSGDVLTNNGQIED
jgi:hypothetical protein